MSKFGGNDCTREKGFWGRPIHTLGGVGRKPAPKERRGGVKGVLCVVQEKGRKELSK